MTDVFLDSSVLIGLVFRHAGERDACRSALPPDGSILCSRYVIFEVARGYLRTLIALNNFSLEFESFADLHLAASSGQQRFKPYRMHTWLGAFSDYFAALEAKDGGISEAFELEEFRAKLRGWIRRGWRRMGQNFTLVNEVCCREDLPPAILRGGQLIDQRLPDGECGQPTACGLQTFINRIRPQAEAVTAGLEALPPSQKDDETLHRIDGLHHLLGSVIGAPFVGRKCHRAGDAIICLEAPAGCVIATKNRKHFEPLAEILGKPLTVSETARSTKSSSASNA